MIQFIMASLVSHPDEIKVVSRRFGQGATDLDRYLELDGYKAVQKALNMQPDDIVDVVKSSGLRGRGGAGFNTGLKWSFVPKQSPKPKYILCNGDESEPGTCKDRLIFEHDPHAVIEGVIIAGLAVGSTTGYIYIRGEYRYLSEIMQKSLADAYTRGLLGKNIFGSGHVERPGVYELPMGYNLKKMIYDVGGGIPNGRGLKGVVPGGSSTPILTADEIDVAMDFDTLMKAGSMLGSGGVVVLDETTCIVKFALRTMKFYQHESCGWCIPCREGTDWLKKTLIRFHAGGGLKKDIDNMYYLSENMLGRTFCPLGDAAAMPSMAFIKKFRKEFEDHIEGRPCPFEELGAVEQLPVMA